MAHVLLKVRRYFMLVRCAHVPFSENINRAALDPELATARFFTHTQDTAVASHGGRSKSSKNNNGDGRRQHLLV